MKVYGECLIHNRIETIETNHPEQWIEPTCVKSWCHGVGFGGHLANMKFTVAKPDVSNSAL